MARYVFLEVTNFLHVSLNPFPRFYLILLSLFINLLTSSFFSTAVYFLYDLSPITVTIKEERRSFLHFITRLCAVLGGTFALTGMVLFIYHAKIAYY